MLHSPGHSPRHNSSPPSSKKTLTLYPSTPITSSSADPSQPPGNAWKRCPTVLDEDAYVAAIEKIVERDFFPDIPKVRDRLDWLEAVRSGDPVLIRDAQLKILERRAATGKTPSAAPDATATGNRSRTRTPTPPSSPPPPPPPSVPTRLQQSVPPPRTRPRPMTRPPTSTSPSRSMSSAASTRARTTTASRRSWRRSIGRGGRGTPTCWRARRRR